MKYSTSATDKIYQSQDKAATNLSLEKYI